jgi:hypothetical protein
MIRVAAAIVALIHLNQTAVIVALIHLIQTAVIVALIHLIQTAVIVPRVIRAVIPISVMKINEEHETFYLI